MFLFFAPDMSGERGGYKDPIWGSILTQFWVQNWSQNGPYIKNQVGQVSKYQQSGWSGLSVLLVLLVSSGLVVWVVPGGCVQFPVGPRRPES